MKAWLGKLTALGPAGLLMLSLLDSAGVPIPGGVDALLILLCVTHSGSVVTLVLVTILGSLLGSLLLFFAARRGGELYLARYTDSPRGARLHDWFGEYGLLTVFVPAVSVIPLPMKVFVLCAGALGVRPVPFAGTVLAARIIRYSLLAWLSMRYGPDTVPFLLAHKWQLLGAAGLLFLLLFLFITVRDRQRRNFSGEVR